MKTRTEDLTAAVREALDMLRHGRPAEAAETLAAALEAPTDVRAVRSAVDADGSKERALRQAVSELAQCSDSEHEARWTAAVDAVGAYVAEASTARDAALEEAAREAKMAMLAWFMGKGPDGDAPGYIQDRICALQSAPARRMLDAEEVRRVLHGIYDTSRLCRESIEDQRSARYAEHSGRMGAIFAAARDIGLDLDAAPAKDVKTCPYCCQTHSRLTSCWRKPEGSR